MEQLLMSGLGRGVTSVDPSPRCVPTLICMRHCWHYELQLARTASLLQKKCSFTREHEHARAVERV